MANRYHGKIAERRAHPYKFIVMRTARQRYSLRVFDKSGLYDVMRFGSKDAVMSALDLHAELMPKDWNG